MGAVRFLGGTGLKTAEIDRKMVREGRKNLKNRSG